MKYSKPLFPQQIQGLDYQTVRDVLEWLKRPITEIRNSVPAYESLAAQVAFDDSFSFDPTDSPSDANMSLWFDSFTVESYTEMELVFSEGSLGTEEEEDDLCSHSTDIVQLIRMKQLRVEEILRLQQKESRRITQLNELKREYASLQEYYHRAETTIQSLVAREHDEE